MGSNSKITTLKRKVDFDAIRVEGRPLVVNSWLVAFNKRTTNSGLRIGWTLPGYVGTAVTRNRVKRWIREYLRKSNVGAESRNFDVNVLFKRQAQTFYKNLKHEDMNAAFDVLFRKMQKLC